VSASPTVDSGSKYYYDIGTLIVTDPSGLGSLLGNGAPAANGGGARPTIPSAAELGVAVQRMAAGSVRTGAVATPPQLAPFKQEDTPEQLDEYMASGNPLLPGSFFCNECSLRMTKHTSKVRKTTEGVRVRVYACPNLE